MSGGKRRVERIPKEWVADIRRRVDAGRAMQDAIKEMLTANAELLVLWRRQQGL
jgi:N-methylhydantoinase B/oxoprolinase/acetone carboxylase alpha subunit